MSSATMSVTTADTAVRTADRTLEATPPAAPGLRRPRPDRQATEYSELSRTVQASGLMGRRLGYYWTKMSLVVLALGGVGVAFGLLGDSWFQLVVAAVMALVITQVAFLSHDAAHRQIFASARWNEWTSLVLANLLGGFSAGWWVKKHTRHHAAPNQEGKDPDIESSPVLALTPAGLVRRGRVGSWLMQRQGWLFFPLLLLEGLNLHVQGLITLTGRAAVKRRWVELSFVTVRLGGYLAAVFLVLPPGKAAAFLGVQLGLFGLYMGCSFAPNHKGMPLVPESAKVDFLRRQVLMSRNIRGGRFVTFALGGLNHQIEHHLFPSMPRPNLARARQIIRPFCAEKGVAYTETGLMASYGIVVRYLNQVGLGSRDPFQCPLVATYRPRG